MKFVSRLLFAQPADRRALSRRACVAAGLALLPNKPRGETEAHHVIITGFSLPLTRILHPFTELHVTDPLRFGDAQVLGFAGLNIRIDAR